MSERGKRTHTEDATSAADAPPAASDQTAQGSFVVLDEFGQPLEFEQSSDEFDTDDSEESVHAGDEDVDEDEEGVDGAPVGDAADAADAGASGDAMDTGAAKPPERVFRPGRDKLDEGEQLEYDSNTYDMHHKFTTDWPCLSFDFIPDSLGAVRTKFPHTMYLVAGTQADRASNNKLMVMKLHELHRTKHDDDDDDTAELSDSDDDEDADPVLDIQVIPHQGGVNRVRVMPQHSNIVATWADTGHVHVWDVAPLVAALDADPSRKPPTIRPLRSHRHSTEGFALAWSPLGSGQLLSGDGSGSILLWTQREGSIAVDTTPYRGHTSSVEDLQWSPSEATVFASCSADRTFRIWDVRGIQPGVTVRAHDTDVNVITWSAVVTHLLASGADDGSFRIWDLRMIKSGEPASHFRWHTDAITSIEWHPKDPSMIAVAGADDQVTLWDLSLERDVEAEAEAGVKADDLDDVPPQLMFVHQGQRDIKEIHWHPQIPGAIVSTALDGFAVFKTFNVS